jgi:4-amino-4-deoxy-L-arabinose transferase-like glycosyltransferase
MSQVSFRWSPSLLLLLALLLALGLRLPFLSVTFFSVDEAVSAVAAESIRAGGLPYRDAIDHRGPLTYYAYAAIFALVGKASMGAVHLVYILLLLGIQGLLFVLGKWLRNAWLGAWAALCYGLFSWANPFHEMWAAHTEWLLTLFSVLAIWLLTRYWERPKASLLLLAGLGWGMAALSKQVAVLEMGAVLAFMTFVHARSRNWKQWFLEMSLIGLGFVAIMGAVVAYFWVNGAWEDWIFYVWTYNTQYYMPEVVGLRRWLNAAKLLGAFFLNKPLLLLLLGMAGWRLPRLRNPETFRQEGWLWAWTAGSLLAALAGGRVFLHYLIPALAPLSLLAALGLCQWWEHRPSWLSLRRGLLIGSLGLLISLGTTFHRYAYLLQGDASITEFEPFLETIRSQSKPDAPIFVWGFAPEFYYLTDRAPASRFSFCNVLTGHIPAGNEAKTDTRYAIVPGVWDTLYQDLSRQWPAFIIDTQPGDYRAYGKYPISQYPLGEWMAERYVFDTLFHQAHPEALFHLYRHLP